MPVKAPKHKHEHIELAASDPNVDPTHTKTLRRDYMAECYKRFRKLKGLIRTAVVDLDIFGLGQKPPQVFAELPDVNKFRFATDAKKVQAFDNWLDNSIQSDLLTEMGNAGQGWQGQYVKRGYDSGLRQSARELKQAGINVPDPTGIANVFNTPIHKQQLELLYTRNLSALKGITTGMSGEISRVLTTGLVKGHNPRKMARLLNDRIDAIGITRARTMARTETIRSHNEAALTRYEQYGIDEVAEQVEWSTAGGLRVCSDCLDMAIRGPYTLKEARGMIPLHPNCRCAWIPVVGSGSKARYGDSKKWADSLSDLERDGIGQWSMGKSKDIRSAQERQYWGDPSKVDVPDSVKRDINNMNKALRNAPIHRGKVYRGMSNVDDSIRQNFTKGSKVEFQAFTSTSKDRAIAKNFAGATQGKTGGVVMELKSRSGLDIHKATGYASEQEVLFRQGAKFEIDDVTTKKVDSDMGMVDVLWVVLKEVA